MDVRSVSVVLVYLMMIVKGESLARTMWTTNQLPMAIDTRGVYLCIERGPYCVPLALSTRTGIFLLLIIFYLIYSSRAAVAFVSNA